MTTPDDGGAALPTVTHTSTKEFLGYTLTMHVLSNGQRVFELNDELRRMLADMGMLADGPDAMLTARKAAPGATP